METCIVYCRKSDPNAKEGDPSFEDQEAACRAYATQQGYTVLRAIHEAHSGMDLLNRNGIWDAMDIIKQGHASVLIAYSYDRLARKPEHQGVILYEVEEKYGGRVECATEQVDRTDGVARITRAIMAEVSLMERNRAVGRMERGKRGRAGRGQLMAASNPRYGYAWEDDEVGRRTTYILDPMTSVIVRRVFNWAQEGKSVRWIARQLNAEGVPTPAQVTQARGLGGRRRVGLHWHHEMVRSILLDPAYAGHATAYRWVRDKKTGKRTQRAIDDASGVVLPATAWPAIVDEATFQAVQVQLSHNTAGRPAIDDNAIVFRHHVYCKVCGSRMYAGRVSFGYVFQCGKRPARVSHPDDACAGGDQSISAAKVDAEGHAMLLYLLTHRQELEALLVKRMGTDRIYALAGTLEGLGAQIQAKQGEAETARRRARQTTDDALAADFIHDAEVLTASIKTLEAEFAEVRKEFDNFNAGNAYVQSILDRVYNVPTPEDVTTLPIEEKRVLAAAAGLHLDVSPVGYNADGKRVDAWCDFNGTGKLATSTRA